MISTEESPSARNKMQGIFHLTADALLILSDANDNNKAECNRI